jgi:hypothetical protein
MNTLTRSWSGRAIALVLAVSLAGLTFAAPLAAEEENDSSYCERVALKCVSEAILSGLFSQGATLPIFLSFCLIGYGFCEKYVEKYIQG